MGNDLYDVSDARHRVEMVNRVLAYVNMTNSVILGMTLHLIILAVEQHMANCLI